MPRIPIVLTAILIFCMILSNPAAADIGVDEAVFTPGGKPNEANLAGDGMLYISDYGAGEVWVVDPNTSAYTRYTSVALASVTDARPATDGRIWFTDNATVFGVIDRTIPRVTTWDIADPNVDFELAGVAFDDTGDVWFTEGGGGTAPTLHRFAESGPGFCSYSFSGGTYSDYLVYHGSYLWFANWSRDRIYRFSPAGYAVTYWPIPAGFAAGTVFDADGNLWWADTTQARLRQLTLSAPSANKVHSFALPVGSAPRMVAAGSGLIWFSEYAGGSAYTVGRVGVLDPAAATFVETASSPVSLAAATESCETPPKSSAATPTVATGTLDWGSATWTTVVDASGWTVYQAPTGAKPWGVALAGTYAWVADEGRSRLARTARSIALAAPEVAIAAVSPDVILSWGAVDGAATFQVCIDATPYFTPGEANCLPESPQLTYEHDNALAGTANYYYYVRARAGAQTSPVSNHVGKFAFGLTPGS